MHALTKARNFANTIVSPRGMDGEVTAPSIFQPPVSGTGYYAQAYRWQLVLHYKYWAAVAIRCWMREIAGGAPINLGRIRPKDRGAVNRRWVNKSLGGPKAHHEFEPYDDDNPLVQVFQVPNHYDVAYDFFAFDTLFYLLTGESHWWAMRNRWGVPREMWVIPTHWMRLNTDWHGRPDSYTVQSPWGVQTIIPYNEVINFWDHSPLNRFEGNPVNLAISEWIDAYESNVRAQLAQYKNGSIPNFHVQLGEQYGDPDEAFLRRFYSKWFSRFQGESHTNLPLITGPGVDVKPLSLTPVEMRYIENDDNFRDRVLAAYGVNKMVVGMEPTNDTCHDAETECLTADGWVRQEELTLNTRVACYDAETNTIVYQRPTNIIRQEYEGPMHRWQSRTVGLDALMTPNHKVWVSRRGRGEYLPFKKEPVGHFASVPSVILKIKQSAQAACAIPSIIEIEPHRYGKCNQGPKGRVENLHIDPMAWMRFLGWFISEGSTTERVDKRGYNRGCVSICQSISSQYVEEIDNCIAATGLKFSKTLNVNRSCWQWCSYDPGLLRHLRANCGHRACEKRVPSYVKDWPARYLQALLHTLINGDGTHYSQRAHIVVTSSKQLADDVQELATKSGWRSSIVERNIGHREIDSRSLPDHRGYRINLLVDETDRVINGDHRSVEHYKGIVWCLEVPTGLMVTRRNGCTLISSNSAYAPQRQFVRFIINPYLHYKSQVITHKIVKVADKDGIGYWDDRVIDDPERKLRELESGLSNGYRTINEVRTESGLAPYPHGGDNPLVGGSPVPWVKQEQQDQEMERAFHRALKEHDGTQSTHREAFADALQREGVNPVWQ